MRKPDRRPNGPEVVDLNARRRAAEVQKQALKAAAKVPGRPRVLTPLTAWGILLAVAVAWTLLSQLLGG